MSTLSIHDQMNNICQGLDLVSAYALHFCTLSASSRLNEIALLTAFRQGLNSEIQHLMVIFDDVIGLETI